MSQFPQCPGCLAVVDSMELTKTFIFVNGERFSAGTFWKMGCCGALLNDDDLVFQFEEESENFGSSVLLNKSTGDFVMGWHDSLPSQTGVENE